MREISLDRRVKMGRRQSDTLGLPMFEIILEGSQPRKIRVPSGTPVPDIEYGKDIQICLVEEEFGDKKIYWLKSISEKNIS